MYYGFENNLSRNPMKTAIDLLVSNIYQKEQRNVCAMGAMLSVTDVNCADSMLQDCAQMCCLYDQN